jgi:GNAT superfamily N-acetyltransferase
VSDVQFPAGFRLEQLRREHPRRKFHSRQPAVDDWLKSKALQHQSKRLSATKVLVDAAGAIAGFYTLVPAQIEFGDLPADLSRRLPHRMVPAALVAWLGDDADHQGRGLGRRLLARSLRDCWESGKVFPFVAVILDCVDDQAKSFYQKCGFSELPGHPYRLFVSAQQLESMMEPD